MKDREGYKTTPKQIATEIISLALVSAFEDFDDAMITHDLVQHLTDRQRLYVKQQVYKVAYRILTGIGTDVHWEYPESN